MIMWGKRREAKRAIDDGEQNRWIAGENKWGKQ